MRINDQDLAVISNHQPQLRSEQSLMKAAVSIILRDGEQGTEFLLMQRAYHENDPWSGQMAFPGGKIEAGESAKAAAMRETHEEVGIELTEQDYVGRLDDLYGLKVDKQYSVHVACFVFKPQVEPTLKANYEVADIVWLPFAHLDNPKNAHDFYHPKDQSVKMPAILINEDKHQILWGLSLRMLSFLYELLGQPMNVLPESEQQIMRDVDNRSFNSEQLKTLQQKILKRQVSE